MGFSPSKTCVLFLFPATILFIQYIYSRDAFSASETSAFKLFPVPCLQHKFLKHYLHKEILQFPTWGKAFSLVLICLQHNLNNFIKHKWHKMETHLFSWQTTVLHEEVCRMATGSPGALPVSSTQNTEVWTPPISQGNEHNCSKMPHS